MKNKLIFLLSICFLLMNTTNLKAQDSISNKSSKLPHGIGLGAGFTTGYGISYKYMPTKFGLQINASPYKSKDTQRYSLGLTFMYKLIERKIANLYLYQANHFLFTKDRVLITYDPITNVSNYSNESNSTIYNGLGFGFEIIIAKSIGFNIMSGYAFYDNFESINLTAETALHFKF